MLHFSKKDQTSSGDIESKYSVTNPNWANYCTSTQVFSNNDHLYLNFKLRTHYDNYI